MAVNTLQVSVRVFLREINSNDLYTGLLTNVSVCNPIHWESEKTVKVERRQLYLLETGRPLFSCPQMSVLLVVWALVSETWTRSQQQLDSAGITVWPFSVLWLSDGVLWYFLSLHDGMRQFSKSSFLMYVYIAYPFCIL